jgi:hypothetical protein
MRILKMEVREMKCEIKKCRNESEVVIHGIELCEKHWKQLTEDFIGTGVNKNEKEN